MYFDITRQLGEDAAVYDGDPPVRIRQTACIDSDGYALSVLSLCTHSGTHIDAPSHYIRDAKTVADIPPETLIGRCIVACDETSATDAVNGGCTRLLLSFAPSDTLIRCIANSSVALVGTSELTIGGDDAHRTLLGRGTVILEALALDGIPAGAYELIALPLRIAEDGSPVRAILKEVTK